MRRMDSTNQNVRTVAGVIAVMLGLAAGGYGLTEEITVWMILGVALIFFGLNQVRLVDAEKKAELERDTTE